MINFLITACVKVGMAIIVFPLWLLSTLDKRI
jgi:hypothetical protein